MTSLAPGPTKGYCEGRQDECAICEHMGDGIPPFGALGKPGRDGKRRVKGCGDPVARGKRNRTKGDRKAAKARRALGLGGPATRHEELWRGVVLIESKAGAKAKPVETFYRNARAQSDASRATGDTRPFVAVACPDGSSKMYAVLDLADLATILEAL